MTHNLQILGIPDNAPRLPSTALARQNMGELFSLLSFSFSFLSWKEGTADLSMANHRTGMTPVKAAPLTWPGHKSFLFDAALGL